MGLLDDAIREHLELKRRHGADPQEVARQEDEALGPIGGHEPQPEPEPELEPEEPLGDEPPAPYEPPTAQEPEHEHEPLHVAEEPAEEPAFELQQPTRQFSLEEVQAATSGPEAPAEPPPPAEAEAPPAEDVVPADDEPEGEDVLEETPEFLQDTPDHDRLWFEQKPPRDFDLDR